LHDGWQVDPAGSVLEHVPTSPFVGGVAELHAATHVAADRDAAEDAAATHSVAPEIV
jgi:hypothetical protein